MSSKQTSHDLLGVITGTPLRQRILDTLTSDPMTMRDLSAYLDTSKSTVKHNLSILLDADLVVETNDRRYRPSPLGRVISDSFGLFLEQIEVAERFEPLFRYVPLPPDTDPILFSGADVTVSSRETPHAASRRLTEIVGNGTSFTGFLPVFPPLSRIDTRRLFENARSIDLISTSVALEMLRRNHAEVLAEQHVEIDVTDDLPFGLLIVDSSVVLQGLDENGKSHVVLESDSEECLNWGRNIVSRVKEGMSCTSW
ncbi:MAG: helix-turn-helix transcriptional regulator [Halanaeroarchaeum sp.]